MNIEKRIEAIERRNAKVEADKAWETSLARKVILLITTYLLISVYMTIINIEKPWLNAIIPSLGFLVSTLTIQRAKDIWLNRAGRRK